MTSQLAWCRPPRSLTLAENEVHVWRAALDLDSAGLERAQATLSPDERDRAARFYFPSGQRHFIAARGILRAILARYLDREPAQFEFGYGPAGKPELAPGEAEGLHFNLSHAQGLALYAIARYRQVGVDLERVRAGYAWEEIAARFFAPGEVTALRSVPAALQCEAFFNGWTRKEAFVKAWGQGLSLPLDQFEVSLVPGQPARLLHVAGDPEEATRWSIRELEPAPGYAAAVAVRAQEWELKLWEFSERGERP
jgi:4'-phosphopantetheinyl transferase